MPEVLDFVLRLLEGAGGVEGNVLRIASREERALHVLEVIICKLQALDDAGGCGVRWRFRRLWSAL